MGGGGGGQMVRVDGNSVMVGGGCVYHCIVMAEFLSELSGDLPSEPRPI